ncbi:MAG TPA: hypothetical protein VKV03_06670 [Candidatus Binataceae bacterium]|nr:hypothetical protein [Candidatus Binataceae bacterium]
MKFLKFVPPAVIAIAIAAAPCAMADGKNITVTNKTTYTMTELYASSSYHATDWSGTSNLLSGQSIAPGQSTTVPISDGTSYCHYDFMGVLYGAAQSSYQYMVNTCDGDSAQWTVTN